MRKDRKDSNSRKNLIIYSSFLEQDTKFIIKHGLDRGSKHPHFLKMGLASITFKLNSMILSVTHIIDYQKLFVNDNILIKSYIESFMIYPVNVSYFRVT